VNKTLLSFRAHFEAGAGSVGSANLANLENGEFFLSLVITVFQPKTVGKAFY